VDWNLRISNLDVADIQAVEAFIVHYQGEICGIKETKEGPVKPDFKGALAIKRWVLPI
jgi:hypothetical protein